MGIRAQILVIALIPGVAVLALGVGASDYFVTQGIHTKRWADTVKQQMAPGTGFTGALLDERRLSMAVLAGDHSAAADLATARNTVNTDIATLETMPNGLSEIDAGESARESAIFAPLFMKLPAIRQQVDSATISTGDVYQYYSQFTGVTFAGMDLIARTAPTSITSVGEARARDLLDATEAVSGAVALTSFAVTKGSTPPDQLTEFSHRIGFYRVEVANLLNYLQGDALTKLKTITSSPQWQGLIALENAVVARGATGSEGQSDVALGSRSDLVAWQADAAKISKQMLDLYQYQQTTTLDKAAADAAQTLRNSIGLAIAMLGVTLIALLGALYLSSRLSRRLKNLRRETLELADDQLPRIMARLQAGEKVDLDADMRRLDYGGDEIGQVGDAFNRAQLAAVTAAVTEARTREGVKSVFINIARRSQVIMHQLLEILDKAEHDTQDPAQLDLLFRMDHLATRERRNAESLSILGGERPGRRWHTTVTLDEVVRGAVAETQNYEKVHVSSVPTVSVIGAVVTDIVHLLAELIDNATSFSPPETRVEVTGGVVGRGVMVEVSDQGLGMTPEQFEQFNKTLSDPPDFTVDTLSSDPRLGLFVIARLARQNDITVRLSESDYGGVRAVVILPGTLIAGSHDLVPAQRRAGA